VTDNVLKFIKESGDHEPLKLAKYQRFANIGTADLKDLPWYMYNTRKFLIFMKNSKTNEDRLEEVEPYWGTQTIEVVSDICWRSGVKAMYKRGFVTLSSNAGYLNELNFWLSMMIEGSDLHQCDIVSKRTARKADVAPREGSRLSGNME